MILFSGASKREAVFGRKPDKRYCGCFHLFYYPIKSLLWELNVCLDLQIFGPKLNEYG